MTKTYPISLAGLYKINFSDLILKPIKLIDITPKDYSLQEIRFECGMGNAIFENGFDYILNVKYDELTNAYTFKYREAEHIFEVQASLGGVCNEVSIMSLVDFTQSKTITIKD